MAPGETRELKRAINTRQLSMIANIGGAIGNRPVLRQRCRNRASRAPGGALLAYATMGPGGFTA